MTLYRTPRLHSFSVRLYGIAPTILAASGRDCWIALFVYSPYARQLERERKLGT
jgi:hypothetical protein